MATQNGCIVQEQVKIKSVTKNDDSYCIHTSKGDFTGDHVVLATGIQTECAKLFEIDHPNILFL